MRHRTWAAFAGAVVLLLAAPAASAFGKTVLVDQNAATAADAPSCGTNVVPCKTIGGALNPADGGATNGDTVSVGSGIYVEQVTITKGVTLSGAGVGATTIQAPTRPLATCLVDPLNSLNVQPIVCVNTASGPVTIENLTINAFSNGSDAGCGSDIEGVYALNSSVTIQNNDVEHARLLPRASLGGCQAGLGIRIVNHDGMARSVTISNNTVNDYQKNGITLRGAGLSYTITGNTVTEAPASDIAPNGIEVGEAGSGTISNNTVSGNVCHDTAPGAGCDVANPVTGVQSAGILLFDNGTVTVSNNHVSGSDIGIFQGDCSIAQGCPGYSGTPSTVNVTGNTLTNNRYEGLWVGAGTTNASGNTITGSNIGVAAVSYNTAPADPGNAVLNLTGNSISGNGTALELDWDKPGANGPVATAHDNSLTNNGNGITNNTTQPVNASDNVISCTAGSGSACVSGPGVTLKSGTLKVLSAKRQIGLNGQTTAITAEEVDSMGHVIALSNGTAIGFATSLGSIPATGTASNGVVTVTLTSGTKAGTAVIAAGFGGQIAETSVLLGTASGPPPASPPLVITGGTIRASKKGVVTFEVFNPQSAAISLTIKLTARIGKHVVTIAQQTTRVPAKHQAAARLTLTKSALKALRKAKHLSVTETTLYSGKSSSTTFTLTT